MTILKGDVKLVKSRVMDDVPEGGGPPTAAEVVDGASNGIFPDISEIDRAAGRVNARKVHVVVQSPDTDTYMGGNVIIARPPNDPNVSVTIFTTNETFDERDEAISRIEAYLFRGANYFGFLQGEHIEGMSVITVIQRTAELPPIGRTLVLTKRQGYEDEFVQYIRVIEAVAVERTFTDSAGEYKRFIITLKLSDPLRADFAGFDVSREDPSQDAVALRTKISDSTVADAAKYYGVQPLADIASIGDFSVKAASIFTQLVPSAQIETPVADARTNQLQYGVASGGAAVTRSFTAAFSPSQSLFIGGGIKPNTLSITGGGVTLTDSGGRLMNAGAQVGTIDYENGILALTENVFGGSTAFDMTYQPAVSIQAVTQSQGIKVTQETRSLSYVFTIEPVPVLGTLSVAYMVAKQWYVLRDAGSGALRGADTSYGAGSLNPVTGTVSVTLGALPDVDSAIICQWVEPSSSKKSDELTLDNDGKLFWPINTDGEVTEEDGSKGIVPGQLVLAWSYGGESYAATDNGQGGLTGDATGTVNYAKGKVRVSFNQLPPKGTPVQMTRDTNARTPFTSAPAAGVGNFGAANIKPRSIYFAITPTVQLRRNAGPWVDGSEQTARGVRDDGNGKLMMYTSLGGYDNRLVQIGTVNYATGDYAIFGEVLVPAALNSVMYDFIAWDNFYENLNRPIMNVYTDSLG